MLKIIVAMDKNRLIGKDGKLPWSIPGDLQYFRKRTLNKTIVMGRKTYDSLGKPLKNRYHVVLTNNDLEKIDGIMESASNIESLVEQYQNVEEEIFVIGGAQIYKQFLPYVEELVISHVKGEFFGDTYFPSFEHLFELISTEEYPDFCVKTYKAVKICSSI